jgi:hypothetical protein
VRLTGVTGKLWNKVGKRVAVNKFSLGAKFILVFVSALANAQPITSLAELKIGMTEAQFLEISDVKSKDFRDITTQSSGDWLSQYSGKDTGIVWKQTNKSTVEPYLAIHSPGITDYSFVMPLGVSSSQGESYKIVARFFENILIRVYAYKGGREFEEILERKYGRPEKEDKTKIEVCQNGYGAKTEHRSGALSSVWGQGSPIVAKITWTTLDCGRAVSSRYSIEDVNRNIKAAEMEKRAKNEARDAEVGSKASSSKL